MNDVYSNYAHVSVLFLDGVGWVERLGIVVDIGLYFGVSVPLPCCLDLVLLWNRPNGWIVTLLATMSPIPDRLTVALDRRLAFVCA